MKRFAELTLERGQGEEDNDDGKLEKCDILVSICDGPVFQTSKHI